MHLNRSVLLDYYYGELYPELETLEKERLRLLKRLALIWGVLAIAGGYILWVLRNAEDLQWWVGAGIAAAGSAVTSWMSADYRRRFKRRIFAKLLAKIDPDLVYRPEGKVSSTLFDVSGLFGRDYNVYRGGDLISATVGRTPIQFSSLKVEKVYKNRRGEKERTTVFAGTFIVTDFHKNFKGSVRIVPDFAEKHLGIAGRWLQDFSGDVVRLDSPAFEKIFKVYADDSVEAHYLLTPNIMEKLVALQKKADAPVYLSFKYNKLFIAIADGGRRFEPTLLKSLLRLEVFKSYIENLNLILGIVDDLNLNRRIWSKE